MTRVTRGRRSATGIGALLVTFSAGCGASEVGDAGPIVRDSAGVRIVENVAAAPDFDWRIDPEPLLSLGGRGAEGPESFSRIVGAIRDAQERVVVLDGASRELRFFAADGSFLHASGGAGEGPGEFGLVSPAYSFYSPLHRMRALIPSRGDSLLVHQLIPSAFHVFDAEGTFARTADLPRGNWAYGHPAATSVLLTSVSGRSDGPPVDGWEQVLVRRADAYGNVEEIGHLPQKPVGEAVRFGPFGLWASTAEGFVSARTDLPEFRYHHADGELSRIVRVPLSAGAVSDTAGPTAEVALVADILPLFRAMVEDRTGHLWIAPYAEGFETPADSLYVVDPDGVFLGGVALPEGLRPMDIGEDWILGVSLDEFDVEHVRLHRLHRSGGD